jgi:hypothetical protein
MPQSSNKENLVPKENSNFQRTTELKATSLFAQPEKVRPNIFKPRLDAGNEKVENSFLESNDKDKRESVLNFSTSGNVLNQLYQRQ